MLNAALAYALIAQYAVFWKSPSSENGAIAVRFNRRVGPSVGLQSHGLLALVQANLRPTMSSS